MTSYELQNLEGKIGLLDAEIEALQKQRAALNEQLLSMLSPFQVGDVIEWNAGTQTWTGRVTKIIDLEFAGRWRVRRIRKDGSEGAECKVYDWDKPRKVKDG